MHYISKESTQCMGTYINQRQQKYKRLNFYIKDQFKYQNSKKELHSQAAAIEHTYTNTYNYICILSVEVTHQR